jgi:hypothetical protein
MSLNSRQRRSQRLCLSRCAQSRDKGTDQRAHRQNPHKVFPPFVCTFRNQKRAYLRLQRLTADRHAPLIAQIQGLFRAGQMVRSIRRSSWRLLPLPLSPIWNRIPDGAFH